MTKLKIENLSVDIKNKNQKHKALDDINIEIESEKITALVGESGCGKSLLSLSIMGLLPEAASIAAGSIVFDNINLLQLREKEMDSIRGNKISMIFQEPMTALNPLMKVGEQIEEALLTHKKTPRKEVKEQVLDIMNRVGLSRVKQLYNDFPHQLSGGMKQRIVIAMALINKPELIIADEPTTALDVTIQYQILEMLRKLNQEMGSTLLLISHDLGVVNELCSNIAVMYAGKIVEEGSSESILKTPKHPYTQGLIKSVPRFSQKNQKLYSIPGMLAPLNKRTSQGCAFAKRCPDTLKECYIKSPDLREIDGRKVSCLRVGGDNE
ncbi:MAG: ABC transporter ATP-binding protein [Spirochaetales bacterium]|nr:ABC transporter ATP-binding protein [Spirochaetales bacterium]